jgi:hypothetical protein
MGYDVYFQSTDAHARTSILNLSYSYNAFYSVFNFTKYKGKTGAEMVEPFKAAIAELTRHYPTLATSKDPYKPLPGNYVAYLKMLQEFAEKHPTWIFVHD